MKNHFKELLLTAFKQLQTQGVIPSDLDAGIKIENTRSAEHGDFACNMALALAKKTGINPRELAEKIIAQLPKSDAIEKIEIAGPGFINAFLVLGAQQQVVATVLSAGDQYGHSKHYQGQTIHLEYVSANPTGPLHVGHGRGAAYGATLANLLRSVGYKVHREYYVNDAGRQMDILAASIWLRYLELCGETIPFPVNGYKGDYIFDIAASIHRKQAENFCHSSDKVFAGVPLDGPEGDQEAHIDGIILNMRKLLSPQEFNTVFKQGLTEIISNIRQDLNEFGVDYDNWFFESSLVESGAVDQSIESLQKSDYLYKKDGATWFKSSLLGDEKDRVIIRDNGLKTYLASDIAYHASKLEGGYNQLIDIWGADHHGYIPRVNASLQALKLDHKKLTVLLVQFAILYRGGEKAAMSTRSGEFVTLRELRHEVGNDAARFFYVLRKCEQHMDFDLDLAKSQSKDNPVYYIQYAHARVCNIFKKLKENNLTYQQATGLDNLSLLNEKPEQALITRLTQYPEIILRATDACEPHQVAYFLRELANDFHSYYNDKRLKKILEEVDSNRRNARLCLSLAVRQVIHNGLTLLGVSSPEEM